ncbi:MAG: tetratricopeptide repeat protein [Candidatus Hinthialibacter antarcticus]|nr:tetratricopeptide repeat protein [Candidatus Hinthialibacter antarcticus]
MPAPMSGQEAADFWIQKGNYPKALLALRPLVNESPDNANLFYQIGYCLVKMGQYEEAHQELQRALSIDPNHAEAKKLLDRVDYNPDAEGAHSIPDDIFNDAIASSRVLKRIACPQCGAELLKGARDCSHCKYVFPQYKLVKAITSVVIVIAFLAGGRYYFLGPDAFVLPMPTLNQTAGFFVGFLQTVTTLFVAALLTNYCELDKAWNFEWKLDLGASVLTAICMAPINMYAFLLIKEISKIPGWAIFLLGVRIFVFIATVLFLVLFFQRKIIYLVLLVLTYYCISPLFYLLFTPLRWLAGII